MRITLLAVAIALFASVLPASAQAVMQRYQLNIPQQPLDTALKEFAHQTGLQVARLSDTIGGGAVVGPVTGELSVEQALKSLLGPVGLSFKMVNDRTIAIVKTEPANAKSPAGKPLSMSGADAAQPDDGSKHQDAQAPFWSRFRLARASEGASSGPAPSSPTGSTHTGSDGSVALEEVVVTGTLIQRPGFTAPTPTTVVTGEDLSLLVGATSVADVATYMPQFVPGQSSASTTSSVSAGSNNFNLRGLGQERTLTLVDGQRQTPSDLFEGLDVNRIPAGIIDRVEVVTGGASAAYGSDAVAGVVNIILRKDIQGLEGSLQGGETSYHDDRNWKATLNYGTHFADDRGRFLIATEAADNAGAGSYGSRSWGNEDWGLIPNPAYTGAIGQYPYVFLPNTRSSSTSTGGVITSGALAGTTFLPGGIPTKFNSGINPFNGGATSGGDGAQIFPGQQINIPTSRQTVHARLSFDITPQITAYVSGDYAHTESNLRNEVPMSLGGGWYGITIQSDNAFLPASLRNALTAAGENNFTMNRDTMDLPWWGDATTTRYHQIDTGLEGRFGQTGSWSARYSFGQYDRTEDYFNDTNLANLGLALDAVTNPTNGQVVCRSTLTSPNNGCVPVNIFGAGSVSPAALAYITNDYAHYYQIRQSIADLKIQAEPFSLWAGPVSVAAGGEYRNEAAMGQFDSQTLSGNNGIYDAPNPGAATIRVIEGFGETVVPLLKDLPLAHELDLNGALRVTSYNTVGEATTWKVGLTDKLTDGLRLRATRSRDIRAPNFSDLEVNGAGNIANIVDHGQPVLVRDYNRANSQLTPEDADTYTAGIVYQSPQSGALQVSLDYFDTKIDNAITALSAQQVVDGCEQGNTSLCANVIRDSGGTVTTVYTGEFNVQSLKVNGVDFDLAYVLPMTELLPAFRGKLVFKSAASYMIHNQQTGFESATVENAGTYHPHLYGNASLIYSNQGWTVSVTGQYIGSECFICALPTAERPQFAGSPRGSAVGYLHGGFEYSLIDSQSIKLQLFGNVNNLLNRKPPVIPYTTGGYWTQEVDYNQYDTIGRRFMLGVRAKL